MEPLYVTVVPVDFAVLFHTLDELYCFIFCVFFLMHVGVGGPAHLHTGIKIFEVLYIICDLFCEAVLCHFEMR